MVEISGDLSFTFFPGRIPKREMFHHPEIEEKS
jgi:hypothetical protein